MPIDVMASEESYRAFYDALGRTYPETDVVFSEALGQTRRIIICSHLRRLASQACNLFDVGCNDGHLTLYYASLGPKAHGIDISASLVEKARAKASDMGLRNASFEVANIEAFNGGPFDAVLFSEVLEHLRRPELALDSIARCLKPRGTLLLTTPAPSWDESPILRILIDRLYSGELLRTKVHTTENTAIRDFLEASYAFRHDEYYPKGLRRWVESFGFRARLVTTFFMAGRFLRQLNRRPLLGSKLPILNLMGLNNLQVFTRSS